MRTTTRLRVAIGSAVEAGRAVDEAAAAHRVSWPTAQRAVPAYAEQVLDEPEPTPLLGLDETRFARVRWVRNAAGSWVRLEPWETGLVDLRCPHTAGGQGLLGQIDARSSRSVLSWLEQRSQAFRDAVAIVAVDRRRPTPPRCATPCPGADGRGSLPPGRAGQPGRHRCAPTRDP